MEKVRSANNAIAALKDEVKVLARDREDSWEAVSHRLSTLVGNSVSSLSERVSELEHVVQTSDDYSSYR